MYNSDTVCNMELYVATEIAQWSKHWPGKPKDWVRFPALHAVLALSQSCRVGLLTLTMYGTLLGALITGRLYGKGSRGEIATGFFHETHNYSRKLFLLKTG